jgi:carboxymethylenebutenolidase
MSEVIVLTSPDGHEFDVFEALPVGAARGSVVVIQEIFGVNAHIREVAQGFAEQGYRALAPALFDRVERQVALGYSGADMMQGVELARGKLRREDALMDLQTAIDSAAGSGPVGVVGYCFGGFLAWLAACQLQKLSCAVSYYGGGLASEMTQTPSVPVMFHFAAEDAHISLDDVGVVEKLQPDAPVFLYEADHGFNCNHRASYNEPAAVLALSRTNEFFNVHLG